MLFRRLFVPAFLLITATIPPLSAWADTATDTATLNACVQTFLQVEVNETGWSDTINPVQFNPITFPITGFVKTNAAGPNTISSPILVEINAASGATVKLKRFGGDLYNIRVFFAGTIGNSPNNDLLEGQPLSPQFVNGEASIALNGVINNASSHKGLLNIPWGELPPGAYKGTLFVTAILSQ